MNVSALIVMLSSIFLTTSLTIYFFYRVLVTPPKPEPDSYLDNEGKEEVWPGNDGNLLNQKMIFFTFSKVNSDKYFHVVLE